MACLISQPVVNSPLTLSAYSSIHGIFPAMRADGTRPTDALLDAFGRPFAPAVTPPVTAPVTPGHSLSHDVTLRRQKAAERQRKCRERRKNQLDEVAKNRDTVLGQGQGHTQLSIQDFDRIATRLRWSGIRGRYHHTVMTGGFTELEMLDAHEEMVAHKKRRNIGLALKIIADNRGRPAKFARDVEEASKPKPKPETKVHPKDSDKPCHQRKTKRTDAKPMETLVPHQDSAEDLALAAEAIAAAHKRLGLREG